VVFTQEPGRAALDAEDLPGNKLLWGESFRSRLRELHPEAILYVPQAAATPMSLLRAACIKRQSGGRPVVLLSLQKRAYPGLVRPFLRALRPDLVLVLSSKSLESVRDIGCRVRRVTLGVDSEVYKPAGPGAAAGLRKRYDLPEGKLILHVGHISQGRNLGILRNLAEQGIKVLMVSSTATRRDKEVEDVLRSPRVVFMDRYIEHIEEIYRLADGYVFPTFNATDAIDVPLSVLEAMATNLPVATTDFGGLPDLFTSGEGLFICSTESELLQAAARIIDTETVATRDKVLNLSWTRAAKALLEAVSSELL
jgi:glycosyltransferase involved in cell wall biosynthesis